ncbi:MAG: FHA domain-containing protein, partial [Cyanobacteria bacterium P01_D01_bin.56]
RRVTIGRPLGEGYPHHIRLSKATGMVSAIQLTLEIRGEGDGKELWVRDGGQRGDSWKPSTNKTRLNSNFLVAERWELLRVGDVLRIGRPGSVELGGFAIKYPSDETVSGTMNGAATTSFGAVEIWHAESIINDKGVMLLRKLTNSDQLVIEKMDYAAEETMGGQPGDLIALSGRLLLDTLITERDDLEIQVRLSMQQRSPVPGVYSGMASKIKLVLNCKDIDGMDWYLAYVSRVEPDQQQLKGWKEEAGQSVSKFATRYPLLFVVGLVASLGLALLIYLLTK